MTDPQFPSRYPNAPLAFVVLEVRFPPLLSDGLSRRARFSLRELLRGEFPLMENMTRKQVTVAVGGAAGGPVSIQEEAFPRFTTRDRTAAFAVTDGSFVIETTSYEGYKGFRRLAGICAQSVEAALGPDGVTRVGLRYFDEIRVPSVGELPGSWEGYIDPHLLAAVEPEFLPEGLSPAVWEGFVRYRTGVDTTLALRYGPRDGYAVDPKGPTRRQRVPDPGPFFLLDSDSYWESGGVVPEFSASEVLEICDRLHGPVRAIFEKSITDQLRREVLAVVPDEEEDK